MEVRRRILEEKHYCHQCDGEVQIELNEHLEKVNMKGVIVDAFINTPTCSQCGSEIYIPQINDQNLDKVSESYRKATGRVLISEIEKILEMYNIGAKPLSILMGWGECTVPRYLKGQIPNIEHSNKLKNILNEPRVFIEIYNKGKDKLTNVAKRKIEDSLSGYVQVSVNESNKIAERSLIEFYDREPNIYNGMTRFSLKKLINSILFFIASYGDTYITKMNKLLWYSDMLCFRRNGHSITGLPYQRIDYGPVPYKYYWIYGSLSEYYFNLEGTEHGAKIQPCMGFDETCFSKEELDALYDVGEKFKFWYSGDISQYSHMERAYKETSHRELIPFSFASDLSLI